MRWQGNVLSLPKRRSNMSSPPLRPSGSPSSFLRRNGQTTPVETDKRATTTTTEDYYHQMQAAASLTMEEGVDIVHAASYVDYNAYSFDVAAAHANSVVDTGNPLEQEEEEEHPHHGLVVGTKRPLEEVATDPMSLIPTSTTTTTTAKRYKTNTTTTNAAAAAAATNKQWDAMFERLVAFKQRNGHCLVPKRYAEDPKLGTWVETQRVQYKRLQREYDEASGMEAVQPNKRLNQERLRKLQEIGFAWSAKHVRKQRNNSLPSTGAPPPPPMEASLADGSMTNPPPPPLPPTAVAATNMMMIPTMVPTGPPPPPMMEGGVVVLPPPPAPPPRSRKTIQAGGRLNDQQWEEMYQRLVRYKEEHGDCLVPRKYERDPKLSTWVETQRFLWNRDYRSAGAENATANSKNNNEAEQDRNYSSSTMAGSMESMPPLPDPTHIPHATTLSDWSPGGDLADGEDAAVVAAAAAAAAEAVDEEVGSTGGGSSTGPPLLAMPPMVLKDSSTQPKRLTKERKEKLDAIGFVWSLRNKRIDDHWDEMFRQLVEYKAQHGDCLVPSRYEANLKLGKWVETQRYEYTKLKRAEANPSPKPDETQEDGKPGAKPRVTNARLTEERLRRLESIGFEWKVRNKMKRYYDKQWQEMFDQLLEFKSRNGHTMVPKRYPDNPRLANWVHTQRIQYRKLMSGGRKENQGEEGTKTPPEYAVPAGEMKLAAASGELKLSKEDEISFRLTDERRRKLEEIGFVWSVRESDAKTDQTRMTRNSYDDLWDCMYERLKAFKEKYGNCLVPKRSKEDPKLGTWVDTQRVQYKKMKKKLADQGIPFDEQKPSPEEIQEAKAQNKPIVGRLTEDRIRRLNELGFVWSLRDDWTKHYEELKEFKKEHGHCNVPARYAKNRRLGIWVSAQRQQYKQMQSTPPVETGSKATPLTKERIGLLNDLGFTWTIRSRDSLGESWNQRLQELREYKGVHGNCLVPSRYPPNPELGIWVGTQRTQYRLFIKARESGQRIPGSSGMNEERIRQLEELGFVWALRGQEGNRRDDTMMQDTEDVQNGATSMASENLQNSAIDMGSENLQNGAIAQENGVLLTPEVPQDHVMLPEESVTVPDSTMVHPHPPHHTEQLHTDHHHASNDPEAILETPAYTSVQEV